MTTKHTQGPWTFVAQSRVIKADCGRIVADANGTADEDARLIASAPELLEACRYALGVLEADGASEFVLSDLRAAIAKATGGEG